MKTYLKIESLYPYDDVYQVVDTDSNTVYLQASKKECEDYLINYFIKN